MSELQADNMLFYDERLDNHCHRGDLYATDLWYQRVATLLLSLRLLLLLLLSMRIDFVTYCFWSRVVAAALRRRDATLHLVRYSSPAVSTRIGVIHAT